VSAAAGEPMRQINDRQPVILDHAAYDAWLDPATPSAEAKRLLARNLDGDLQFHRVSRTVNSVKDQGGDCIEPTNWV
jgi:putative SOS response-associated peptidase YedK